MRVAQRASLLVAFYLLASAATAYAECAWVLWSIEWYDAGLDRPWSLIQTAATRPDCLAAMERTAQTFKETMRGDVGVGRDTTRDPWALFVVGKGHSVTLRCLPDTVDPRGAKGGAR
jgi:hypothetical protein